MIALFIFGAVDWGKMIRSVHRLNMELDLQSFYIRYDIQHCFICRPSDSTVSEDAGIEPRTVATTALAVRRSNNSALSHPHYKVHIYKEYHSVCPLVGIGTLPPPSHASECAPPPQAKGGRAHSPAGEGWGSPNSDDWRKSLALCLLCDPHRTQKEKNPKQIPI